MQLAGCFADRRGRAFASDELGKSTVVAVRRYFPIASDGMDCQKAGTRNETKDNGARDKHAVGYSQGCSTLYSESMKQQGQKI